MALHSSLPIYKVAYDLLSVATDVTKNMPTGNSYFGLLRQASASHHDRARLANIVRRRGHAVDRALTQAFRRAS